MKNIRRLYSKLNRHRNNVEKQSRAKAQKRVISRKPKFKKSGLIKQYEVSRATLSELQERSTGGYIELEQGFTIQWGRVLHKAGSAEQPQAYRFKKKFSHSCFGISVNMQRSGTKSANASEITNIGFEIDSDDDLTGDRFINYIAIGY